eukprot:m.121651 g.121651  ORF g.121651 m.121651 type:complete len:321 (-) comp14402_c0_seq8:1925-2887(-)
MTKSFQLKDKVAVEQRGVYYEAVVVSVSDDKPGQCKVHYKGYKAHHDNWVPVEELKPLEDAEKEGLLDQVRDVLTAKKRKKEQQARLREIQKHNKEEDDDDEEEDNGTKADRKTGSKQKKKKRKHQNSDSEEEDEDENHRKQETKLKKSKPKIVKKEAFVELEKDFYNETPQIRILIPIELKAKLVDNWKAVTQQSTLVKIPKKPNVNQILEKFQTYAESKSLYSSGVVKLVTQNLRDYFQKSLANHLLYDQEKKQYDSLKPRQKESVCTVYGAEHLLRLFTRLQDYLGYTNMSPRHAEISVKCLADFLKYFQVQQAQCF